MQHLRISPALLLGTALPAGTQATLNCDSLSTSVNEKVTIDRIYLDQISQHYTQFSKLDHEAVINVRRSSINSPMKRAVFDANLHCCNSGSSVTRQMAIMGITDFCSAASGHTLDANSNGDREFAWPCYGLRCAGRSRCWDFKTMSITVKDGCILTIPDESIVQGSETGMAYGVCGGNFRNAIDECNAGGTENKQGGTMETECAVWRFDPNQDLSDCRSKGIQTV